MTATSENEDDLRRLEAITDLLGPNMWLELDRVSFPWFFGHELDSTRAEFREALRKAKSFAKERRLVFAFDQKRLLARFSRKYFERDEV